MGFRALLGTVAAVMTGACATQTPEPVETPAVFSGLSDEERSAIGQAAATLLGRNRVDALIVEGESTVAIRPPMPGPFEGNSPVRPEVMDIIKRGDVCVLRDRSTGQEIKLTSVSCSAKSLSQDKPAAD